MENVKEMKFPALKVLAAELGWKEIAEGSKVNFIGVSKAELIDFIQEKQNEADLENIRKQAEKSMDGVLSAKDMATELGITPKSLRRKLRSLFPDKEGHIWKWDHQQYDEVITRIRTETIPMEKSSAHSTER